MKYEKPEVTSLGCAIANVQASEKAPVQQLDSLQQETIGAYQADE